MVLGVTQPSAAFRKTRGSKKRCRLDRWGPSASEFGGENPSLFEAERDEHGGTRRPYTNMHPGFDQIHSLSLNKSSTLSLCVCVLFLGWDRSKVVLRQFALFGEPRRWWEKTRAE